MADNITLNSGSGGSTLATDDITDVGGAHYQRVKLTDGTANSETHVHTGNGTATNSLRVSVASDSTGQTKVTDGTNSLTVAVEDAAHGSGDGGIAPMAVRNDNLATLAGTDGDYAPFQVNADGALYSTLGSVQSTGNTTTTPVANPSTFTGTGELNEYPDVMVSFQADDTGTLYFDFSVDGSNWSTFPVNGFTVASGIHEFHTASKGPRYFRVRWAPAGTATYTRLYTYYGTFSKLPNAPLNQAISNDADSIITTSVIAADNGSNYVNIGATTAGNLKISIQEISDGLDIGAGNAGTETQRVSISTDDVNLSGILADTGSMDTNLATVAGDTTSIDGKLPASAALTDNFATPTTTQMGSMTMVYDGATWDMARGDATDGLLVNLGTNNDVTISGSLPAGTNNIGDVDIASALPAGTNNIGDVDIASAIPAGTNVIGDVGISGTRTSGGTTLYKNIDVDETEDEVKSTGGQVYWIHAINVGTAPRYLKFYNATAATVIVGTTTPDLTFPVPSAGSANGSGFTISIPNGIAFSTAITIAATTGVADNDSGAPGANEVIVNLGYA